MSAFGDSGLGRKPQDHELKMNEARGAGDSVKPRTPAEMLGRGPRPGVERSGTPGNQRQGQFQARGAGRQTIASNIPLVVFKTISLQELYEFVSKRDLRVMLFLSPNVTGSLALRVND